MKKTNLVLIFMLIMLLAISTGLMAQTYALDFDGTDYVSVPHNDVFNWVSGAFTVSAWFKTSSATFAIAIVDKHWWDTYPTGWSLMLNISGTGTATFAIGDGNNPNINVNGGSNLNDGKWHQAVAVRSAIDSYSLFIDGVNVGNSSSTKTNIDNSYAIGIGARATDPAFYFSGLIDEVRIWNVARTQTQIRDWMHKTEGLTDETSLVSVWHLDESTVGSNSALDSKGSNHGTPTTMTNDDCVTSTAPFGTKGKFVATQTETSVGPTGGLIKTTITSVPSDANNLGVYQFGSLSGDPVTSGETFPGGFNKRSNIVWGVAERGAVTATLVFDYSGQPGVSGASTIEILKRDDANDTVWEEVTESSRDNDAKTITLTGVESFSEYALGAGADNTLPVELSTFTAQFLNNTPTLYWTTQSETDNMGWFVYRNIEEDFTTSEKISQFIEGHGTTTQQQSYLYEDRIQNPEVGSIYYYWLESIDYSGMVNHYDKVAVLTIPDQHDPGSGLIPEPELFGLLQNKPNPFIESTKISFNLYQTAKVDLNVYNLKGQLVKTLFSGVTSKHTVMWDGKDENGKQLENGVYLYKLLINGKTAETKKLILMR